MKSCFRYIFPLFLMFVGVDAHAQAESERIVMYCAKRPSTQLPLYVFKVSNKEKTVVSLSSLSINPDWIKSLKVLKPSESLKYGRKAKNGVLILEFHSYADKQVLEMIRQDARRLRKIKS